MVYHDNLGTISHIVAYLITLLISPALGLFWKSLKTAWLFDRGPVTLDL